MACVESKGTVPSRYLCNAQYLDLESTARFVSIHAAVLTYVLFALPLQGDEGLEADVDRAFDIAHCFANAVKNSNGAFVLASEPQCTNVCFWYVPPHLRPFDINNATEEQMEELHEVAPKIKAKMQEVGDALIGFQTNRGLPTFFRIV